MEEEAGPAGRGPWEWTRPQAEHWAGKLGRVAGACGSKWRPGARGGVCSHQATGWRPAPSASPPTPRQAVLRCLAGPRRERRACCRTGCCLFFATENRAHSLRAGGLLSPHPTAPTREPLYTSTGKESACSAGDLGLIPGLGRSPGEGNGYPLQYSGLENSMDCKVHRVAKSRTRLSDLKKKGGGQHQPQGGKCGFFARGGKNIPLRQHRYMPGV